MGNGLCLGGVCMCNVGFGGADCTIAICGVGRVGPDCEQDRCPGDCSAHGLCLDGKCLCLAGWAGMDCIVPSMCTETCMHVCAEPGEKCQMCVGQCQNMRSHPT